MNKFVMSQNGTTIVPANHCLFNLTGENIEVFYNNNYFIIGKYSTGDRAEKVLQSLFSFLGSHSDYDFVYFLPRE